MNVLLLSPWLPWPAYDGGRIRILETLRHLSRRHRVTLVTSVYSREELEHQSALKGLCEQIVVTLRSNRTAAIVSRLSRGMLDRRPLIQSFHYDAGLARNVTDLTSRIDYDVIHVEFPFLAHYLKAVAPRQRAKKILTMHNIESLRFKRELQLSQWGKRRLLLLGDHLLFPDWEEKALLPFDGIVAVSEIERKWIERKAPRAAVRVVPNGVDTNYFNPNSPPLQTHTPYIIFTGVLDYPPNVDAACWFSQEVWPALHQKHSNLQFKIVGKNPEPRIVELGRRPGIEVTGTVPDIRPYVAGALALVVPLRSGGGTRLKILEGMALERPVIATSVGAEGLEVTPGSDILIADGANAFVESVELLLGSTRLRENLGRAGRRLVVQKYDWRACLEELEILYQAVMEKAAA